MYSAEGSLAAQQLQTQNPRTRTAQNHRLISINQPNTRAGARQSSLSRSGLKVHPALETGPLGRSKQVRESDTKIAIVSSKTCCVG